MSDHNRLRFAPATAALWLTALVVLGLGACRRARVETGAQPAAAVMTDANISSIVATANTGEIEQARLALSKSSNRAVREFAQRMITDHTAANQQLEMVLQELNMRPVADPTSQQLMSSGRQTLESLGARSGEDFDRTYMETQVSIHRWLLATIDSTLIPAADSEELEELVVSLRPTVASHLQHAEQVVAGLGRRNHH